MLRLLFQLDIAGKPSGMDSLDKNPVHRVDMKYHHSISVLSPVGMGNIESIESHWHMTRVSIRNIWIEPRHYWRDQSDNPHTQTNPMNRRRYQPNTRYNHSYRS